MRKRVLALALGCALYAPAASAQTLLDADQILQALPGVWAMYVAREPDTEPKLGCDDHAISIAVTKNSNGSFQYTSRHAGKAKLPDGEDGVATSPICIMTSGGKARSIMVQYEDETRLDDKGKPVRWMLLMPDRETFYWHRADWPTGAVTAPSHRCPDPDFVG